MKLEYFQLISRIEALDIEGATLQALGQVPKTSTIFEGHFPGYPIMPGVLLIESMAQACGHLVLATTRYAVMPFLIEVRSAKMRSFVEPGEQIAISARLEHLGSGFAVCHGLIAREGKKIAEAEIRFRTMPFPSDAMRGVMLDLVESLGLPRPDVEGVPRDA